jgi:hypothetical protein
LEIPLNNGGLYGERYGWYLPFFNDFNWQQVFAAKPDGLTPINWRRRPFGPQQPAPLACLLPVLKALRINPTEALRE